LSLREISNANAPLNEIRSNPIAETKEQIDAEGILCRKSDRTMVSSFTKNLARTLEVFKPR